MKYYIQEIPPDSQNRGAWGKARSDTNIILHAMGFVPLYIKQSDHQGFNRYIRQIKCLAQWEEQLSGLIKDDLIVLQYPPLENSLFLMRLFERISKRDVKIVTLIHDFIPLTVAPLYKKLLYLKEDSDILKLSSCLIVHNDKMAAYLYKKGVSREKVVPLGIFDYCMDTFNTDLAAQRLTGRDQPVIISGTLNPEFSGKYLERLPENMEFNLFGKGYIDRGEKNIHYYGSFSSTDLPYKFSGSFGLVWYGDRSDRCSSKINNYLKIINPHRTSSYLAAEIPVICWSKMAVADFILEHNCGFVVDSLYDIADIVRNMTDTDYEKMRHNAAQIGEKLRNGYFLRKAMEQIINH